MLIRVEGADKALRALRQMEPLTAKEVGREVSGIGKRIAAVARANASGGPPASGWVQTSGKRGSRGGAGWPAWEPLSFKSARRGMTVRVTGTSPSGVIESMYETMGRETKVKTPQGRQLIANMNNTFGPVVRAGKKAGRMRRIAAENYAQAEKDLESAVNKAVDAVNRLMP